MSEPSTITATVRAAAAAGRPAVIPFLTGGFPGPESFWAALDELADSGADIIEIGAPFSDPVADGPVVAAASLAAIEGGATLASIVAGLKSWPGRTPLVLMSYANPLVQYGWERSSGSLPGRLRDSLSILASDLAGTMVKGVIVPDTPLEELGPFHEAFRSHGIDLIPLVGPNTTRERMALYKPMAGGYVYVVSALGTTGVREGSLPKEAVATIERARSVFDLPIALGFGIRDPGQLAELGAGPDAVIIGSALLRHLAAGGEARAFMAPWAAGRGGA